LEGVQPLVVSEMLGHASVAFTLATYGHVQAEMRKPARDAMERLFGRALEGYDIRKPPRRRSNTTPLLIVGMSRCGGGPPVHAADGLKPTEDDPTIECGLVLAQRDGPPDILAGHEAAL
jgi:hypothetical protein